MRACDQCGNLIELDAAAFCPRCGQKLEPVQDPPTGLRLAPAAVEDRTISDQPTVRRDIPLPDDLAPAPDEELPTALARSPMPPADPIAMSIPSALFEEGWEPWTQVHPLPKVIQVRGRAWTLQDTVEPSDSASADAHDFEISGSELVVKEEGEGQYPSGNPIFATGLRQRGGTAAFTVRNLQPGSPIMLARQVLALGPERTTVTIDGTKVGSIEADEVDRDRVWRNRMFAIASDQVRGSQARLEFSDDGSEPGLTWFTVWVFQSL